jgi:hypothetical protein
VTTSTTPGSTLPPGRYGAPRPWVRWLSIVTVIALALSGSGWLLWAALYQATPQVESRLVGFTVADRHRIDVVVQVDRSAAVAATCRITAQGIDHGIVGQLVFVVPADAASSVTVNQSVTTERAAATAVLDGCTTAAQPQPR